MKRGYSIAIDVSALYSALGGKKSPAMPNDPKILQQAEEILQGNTRSFKPAVFSTIMTKDNYFLYYDDHEFSFAPETSAPNGFYAAPNTPENNRILQDIWPREGQRFLNMVAEIHAKALEYCRTEHPKAKSIDNFNKTYLFIEEKR